MDGPVNTPIFVTNATATSCKEGTLKLPSSLIHESRALKQSVDSHEDEKDDSNPGNKDRPIHVTIDVTQSSLDNAARLLKGGEPNSFTDEQWRVIADVACRMEQAVIGHYKKLLVQDPVVVSKVHDGIADLDKRVDVSLARLVLGDIVREGRDVCRMAQRASAWKTVSLGGHCLTASAPAVVPDGGMGSGSLDYYMESRRGMVTTVVVLRDGRIAVAYTDHFVWVWNPVTLRCDAILLGHRQKVRALAGLPDGRLASGSCDGLVRLWDIETSTCTKLTGHTGIVSALAVLPDGVLASGSWDGSIRLWDTTLCVTLRTLYCPYAVAGLAVLSDGHLAAHTRVFAVQVWRTDTYERVAHLDFSSNGLFGCPSASDTLATWIQRLKELAQRKHDRTITAFAGLPDGRTVQLFENRTVQVGDETLISMPRITSVIAGCTGDVVVAAATSVTVFREVPSRTNVFLALTALGVPPPYILKIMSGSTVSS